jgi:hypothetical protein
MSLHLLSSLFAELKHCISYPTRDGIVVRTPGNQHIEVVTKFFDEPAVLAALEAIVAAMQERVTLAGRPLVVVETPTSSGITWEFKEEQPKDVQIGKVTNLEQPGWLKDKMAAKAALAADIAKLESKVPVATKAPAKRGRPKKD